MKHLQLDNSKLLQLLALEFPDGSPAEFGRRLSHEYEAAYNEGHDKVRFGSAICHIMTGQIRWGRVSRMLHEFAAYAGWTSCDVKMGSGEDNHVKMQTGCLSFTCHHVSPGQVRPAAAKYLNQAYETNGLLSQMMLFERNDNIDMEIKILNVQIQHSANPLRAKEIHEIEFVFADISGTIAKFSISDLITCQGELYSLATDELNLIRKEFHEMGFNLKASA